MADTTQICIRCGSRAHSTRDHDEGKVGGAPAATKKPAAKKAADGGVGALLLHTPHPPFVHCLELPPAFFAQLARAPRALPQRSLNLYQMLFVNKNLSCECVFGRTIVLLLTQSTSQSLCQNNRIVAQL